LAEAHVEGAVRTLLDVNRPLHPILGELDAMALQRLRHAGRDRGIELQGHLCGRGSRMRKADAGGQKSGLQQTGHGDVLGSG
jgi:hypothetical protein